MRRRPVAIFILPAASLAAAAAATWLAVGPLASPGRARAGESPSPAFESTVHVTTGTGRRGTYYLPGGHEARLLPLLVALHGTNGTGAFMVWRLRALAERHRFIIVAPDSVGITGTWGVGHRPDEVTEDYRHILRCVREVLTLPGVRVDAARVLIAGYSVGGSAALYVASHDDLFTAFAVLHGHVAPQVIGPRRVRGWFSAGDRDRLRTVGAVKSAVDHLTREAHFPEVQMRVFATDHTLREDELNALVAWWLRVSSP
jgi:poly(3-hydroxybutyrate) depolymerase